MYRNKLSTYVFCIWNFRKLRDNKRNVRHIEFSEAEQAEVCQNYHLLIIWTKFFFIFPTIFLLCFCFFCFFFKIIRTNNFFLLQRTFLHFRCLITFNNKNIWAIISWFSKMQDLFVFQQPLHLCCLKFVLIFSSLLYKKV